MKPHLSHKYLKHDCVQNVTKLLVLEHFIIFKIPSTFYVLFHTPLNILLLLSSSAQVSRTLFNIPFVFLLRTKRNRLFGVFFFFLCLAWFEQTRVVLGFYKLYHIVKRCNLCPDIFLQSDLTVFLLLFYACVCFLSLFPDWFHALLYTACRLSSTTVQQFYSCLKALVTLTLFSKPDYWNKQTKKAKGNTTSSILPGLSSSFLHDIICHLFFFFFGRIALSLHAGEDIFAPFYGVSHLSLVFNSYSFAFIYPRTFLTY